VGSYNETIRPDHENSLGFLPRSHRQGWGLNSNGAGVGDFNRTSAESTETLDALNCICDSGLLAADTWRLSFKPNLVTRCCPTAER
jgi:hypothetical protein